MAISGPNYTQFPDELLDLWMAELSDPEWRALCYITRHTFGYRKTTDAISYKQFMHGLTRSDGTTVDRGCGIKNRNALAKALTGLQDKGIIIRTIHTAGNGAMLTATYAICVEEAHASAMAANGDPSTPRVLGVVRPEYHPSTPEVPTPVRPEYPQETSNQKTTTQEKGCEDARAREGIIDMPSMETDVQRLVNAAGQALGWEKIPPRKYAWWAKDAAAALKVYPLDDLLRCLAWFMSDGYWRDHATTFSLSKAIDAVEDWRSKGKPASMAKRAAKAEAVPNSFQSASGPRKERPPDGDLLVCIGCGRVEGSRHNTERCGRSGAITAADAVWEASDA